MKDVGTTKGATRLSLDGIDEAKEESLPSSNRMEVELEPQTQPLMSSEELQWSARIRTSPQVLTKPRKRKM